MGTAFAGLGTISGRRTSDNVTEITFVPNAGIEFQSLHSLIL